MKQQAAIENISSFIMGSLKAATLLLIFSSFIINSKANAAVRTDTFTYTGWEDVTPSLIAGFGATETVPHTFGNDFNPSLNDPFNSSTASEFTYEGGMVNIASKYICDAQREVSINIGGFNVKRTKVNNDFDGDTNKDPYLYGGVNAFLGYNSSNANIIATMQGSTMTQDPTTSPATNTFDFAPITINATFAELFTNTPFVLYIQTGSHLPYGSTGSYVAETPTITLTYDDSDCPRRGNIPPVINGANASISTNTANGTIVINGSVLGASDADGDPLSYSIVSGNNNNYFVLNGNNIRTNSSNIPAGVYKLTLKVSDGQGGEASAIAVITVTGNMLPSTGLGAPILGLILSIALSVYLFITTKTTRTI
jgi:hypothetical protein